MKVSVVIPAYNAEQTIIRALDSVINQSLKPYEIIIIDDGSRDNTYAVIDNYAKENAGFNFKLIKKENGGVSSARNEGLKVVQGDFIAFLDSDDEWYTEKLEVQMACLSGNPEIDFLGSAFQGIYFEKRAEGELIPILLRDLIFKNYFQPSTVIMKRAVLDKVGLFREDQKYAEEGNYFMRVADKFKCYFLNRKLINYSDGKSGFGTSGLSANLLEMEKGELRNLSFARSQKYIGLVKYGVALVFSILKFVRRVIIVKILR
jgi:glycosyltransferase involved in cell wall biosynthesis